MQIFKSFTQEVTTLIKSGAVGVIPTDTVYGVIASLGNTVSVERLYKIKQRDRTKRVGTILINDPLQIERWVSAEHLLRAEIYWPGPTGVVLPVNKELSYAHKGWETLAFRVPDNEPLRELLVHTGPLATSSANLQGQLPISTMQDALSTFRGGIDFYVDGGDLSHQKPSRIIEILHNGTVEEIRK